MRGKVLTVCMSCQMKLICFLWKDTNLLQSINLDWLTKFLYLSCIFEKINSLNLLLQGESIDILKAYNKIKAFKKKIQHWASRVEIERMFIFSELNDYFEENEFNQRNVKQSISSHHRNLSQCFDKYFSEDITPQQHDWILSPLTISNNHHLSSDLIEALDDLSSDRGLKIAFYTTRTLTEFWLSAAKEYPQLSVAAMNVFCHLEPHTYVKRRFQLYLTLKTNIDQNQKYKTIFGLPSLK